MIIRMTVDATPAAAEPDDADADADAGAERPRPALPARRRLVLAAPLAAAFAGGPAARAADAPATAAAGAASALRAGRCVAVFRHALAPGTFDPPGFRLDDCATQRNLSAEGRAQARRLGEWFRAQRLAPAAVRSSPWCRCLDTAEAAFPGRVQHEPALGSPVGSDDAARRDRLAQLRRALAAASGARGFEVWVTHMFVIADLAGENVGSGDGLVIAAGAPDAPPRVLARLSFPA
jgi:hypothetical protein